MAASIKALLALVAVVLLAAGYLLYTLDNPVKTIEIRTGTIGDFSIGESKELLLSRALTQSFSPQPKTPECPGNWIVVGEMTQIQKGCLLHTDIWDAEPAGLATTCPSGTNSYMSLHFGGGKLAKVLVRCSRDI